MTFPSKVVIDTNVLITANGKSEHTPSHCMLAAIEFLSHTQQKGVVYLDTGYEIYDEYKKYCSYQGQPGLGDRFFMHIHQSQANSDRVYRVDISPTDSGSYEEIPPTLGAFDASDKKFVATVIAANREPTIVNCTDSDWRESEDALEDAGIKVLELDRTYDTEP